MYILQNIENKPGDILQKEVFCAGLFLKEGGGVLYGYYKTMPNLSYFFIKHFCFLFTLSAYEEDTIIHAITRSLSTLPSLESMAIFFSPQLKRVNAVPAMKYKWYQTLRDNPR